MVIWNIAWFFAEQRDGCTFTFMKTIECLNFLGIHPTLGTLLRFLETWDTMQYTGLLMVNHEFEIKFKK